MLARHAVGDFDPMVKLVVISGYSLSFLPLLLELGSPPTGNSSSCPLKIAIAKLRDFQ